MGPSFGGRLSGPGSCFARRARWALLGQACMHGTEIFHRWGAKEEIIIAVKLVDFVFCPGGGLC